ncbi:hypothetical protein DL98DRAFT_315174 [Cadophora sp. DSE1049]|nr:hypothetical protein DL98DRAFT_315174 [Cadophora sp. DSE1049]
MLSLHPENFDAIPNPRAGISQLNPWATKHNENLRERTNQLKPIIQISRCLGQMQAIRSHHVPIVVRVPSTFSRQQQMYPAVENMWGLSRRRFRGRFQFYLCFPGVSYRWAFPVYLGLQAFKPQHKATTNVPCQQLSFAFSANRIQGLIHRHAAAFAPNFTPSPPSRYLLQ